MMNAFESMSCQFCDEGRTDITVKTKADFETP